MQAAGQRRGGFRGRSCPSRRCAAAWNWASIGLAHEALVGVKHSFTLWRAAQARVAGVLLATADLHPPDRVVSQIVGELADAPGVNGRPSLAGRGGRLDDVLLVVTADLAGTASRPPKVQRRQPPLIEGMDDVPDGVLVRLDEPAKTPAPSSPTPTP